MFEGYKDAKGSSVYEKQRKFNHLLSTPYLEDSQYLSDLYQQATSKEQKDCILEHMNRFTAWEVKTYKALEKKIIDERWK
jgi:hypothetical protein